MKTLTITLCGLAFALCSATAQSVSTTTVTPTVFEGTVTTFDPTGTSIILSAPNTTTPVTYGYSKSTVVVDSLGNPVAVDTIKTGVPVKVYYTSTGGQMVASKIMVQKAAPVLQESTTTTTTTVTDDDDDDID